jgi:hypothetical protein
MTVPGSAAQAQSAQQVYSSESDLDRDVELGSVGTVFESHGSKPLSSLFMASSMIIQATDQVCKT